MKPINWQFTNDKARIKLKSVYPDLEKAKLSREESREAKRNDNNEDSGCKPNAKK